MGSNTAETIQTVILSVAVVAALLGCILLGNECSESNKKWDLEEQKIMLQRAKAQLKAKREFLVHCLPRHTPSECTLMWKQ